VQGDLVVRGDPDAASPPLLRDSSAQSPDQAGLFSFFVANASSPAAAAIAITLRSLLSLGGVPL